MIAKFTCTECGEETEVEFDPEKPPGMLTLRLYVDADRKTRRKCDHCGEVFSVAGEKKGTAGL